MMPSNCIQKNIKLIIRNGGLDFLLNEKSIIFRLIFELGCPVFVIAKTLGTSEVGVYRYLNGEKMSRKAEVKLKRLWQDLVNTHS